MDIPITIGDAILVVLGVCGIFLLVYMIRVLRALIPVLKTLKQVLDDTQAITGIVSDAAVGIEDTVAAVSDTSQEMAEFITNNQSTFHALVNLINAIVSIKNLFS